MSDTLQLELGYVVTFGGLARSLQPDTAGIPFASDTFQPSSSVFESPYVGAMASVRMGGALVPDVTIPTDVVSPLRGDPSRGQFSVRIVLSQQLADDYPEVQRYFMQRTRKPVAQLAADVLPTDTEITLKPGGGAVIAAAIVAGKDVLYINREAFRAVEVDGDVVTIQDALPDGRTRSADGVRGGAGLYATTLDTHRIRRDGVLPYEDDQVYVDSPFLRDREMVVYRVTRLQSFGSEVPVGRYWIESVEPIANGTAINVVGRDLLRVLWDIQLNDLAVRYTCLTASPYIYADPSSFTIGSDATDWETTHGPGIGRSSIWSVPKSEFDPVPQIWGHVQAEDRVYEVFAASPVSGTGIVAVGNCVSLPVSKDSMQTPIQLVGNEFYEVLLSDPAAYPSPSGSPLYDPNTGEVAVHPLDILRCVLGTRPSMLPSQWQAGAVIGITAEAIDDAEIVRLRDGIFAGITAPGIVAFGDGKSVPAGKWITEKLLRPIGCSLGINASGQLTVRALEDSGLDAAEVVDSSTMTYGRDYRVDFDAQTDAIVAETARKADGKATLKIYAAGAVQHRFNLTRSQNVVTIDAECMSALSAGETNRSQRMQRYAARLGRIAAFMRLGTQVLTGTALATADLSVGTTRRLSIYGLRNADTGAIETTPSTIRILIFSLQTDWRFGIQRFSALMLPWERQTKIGPAARVTGGDDTTVEVAHDTYIAPLNASGVYSYGIDGSATADSDCETFEAGDFIIARSSRLVPLTDPSEVQTIGTDAITVATPLTLVGGGAYVPAAGDVITYARRPDCTERQTDLVAFFDADTYTL